MHLRAGPHVQAAAGAVGQHQGRVAAELAGDHQFLRIAARQQRGFLPQRAHAQHVERLDGRGRVGLHPPAVEPQRVAVAAGMHLADAEVLGDGQAARQRQPVAVGRDRGDAERAALHRAGRAQVAEALQVQAARRHRQQAHDRLRQLALAVAADAGQAVDLAGMHREVDAVERRWPVGGGDAAHAAQHQPRHAAHRRGPGRRRGRLAHGEPYQVGLGRGARVERGDGAAAAHHGHPVGVALHVGHLVGDQDHGRALATGERLHGLQQPRGLGVGEDRGGLVQDQDAGAGQQHLQDLDPLLLGDGEVADAPVGVGLEAQRMRLGEDRRADTGQPLAVAAHVVVVVDHRHAQQDVLGDGEGCHQLEVLVDHADAVFGGVARTGQAHRVLVDPQFAGLGRVEAGGDVHQRGLAGAVLAEQGMDFAPLRGEVRIREGDEAVEGFVDVGEGEGGRHGQRWWAGSGRLAAVLLPLPLGEGWGEGRARPANH